MIEALPPAMPDWSPVRTLRRLRRLGGAPIGNNRAALKELEQRKREQQQLRQQQACLRLRQPVQRPRPPARDGVDQQAADRRI